MKFTGFAVSFALAGAVSALPALPGGSAVSGIENTVGSVVGGALKRGDTDALTGATYGLASNLNGVTGIAGSLAGTAESTTAGAVGTVEKEVAGVLPAKRQLDGAEGAVGGIEGAVDDTLGGFKRDGADALGGAVYGITSSLNGVTGIAGSVAGTAESTTSGAVGTVEKGVSGIVPAKRQLDGAEGAVDGIEGAAEGILAGVKRDDGDALSGAVYGATSSLNGVTGIAGSVAGTAESTTSGAVGTVEQGLANALPAKRQLGGLGGLGTVVDASLTNDLSMLSGNPSGLIGALGGLQVALAKGDITHGQISNIPVEMQHVVAFLYTA
ncbi:hypothetical protein N7456_009249 [Penicillium angulare]|uniref:Uncharacterized protein n=1 Tax=Penicillium angulare TaxID=116970 RepID=A0A9W9K511_9EURO|nr:hypothetical protein N7456_009249 [Penicillium angulare]